MFKLGGLLRNEIVSDEGFTVAAGGESLLYSEGKRQMRVTTEAEPSGFAVDLDRLADGTTICRYLFPTTKGSELPTTYDVR